MKFIALTALTAAALLAQDNLNPDRIKAAQETQAHEKRDQEKIELALQAPCQVAKPSGDPRTKAQKASDKKLLDEYFTKYEPTGKPVAVKLEDGATLYVPEVRLKK